MQVFRFDRDIAMTLSHGDGVAQLGQLLGPSALEQAGILYLNEGDHFAPPPSTSSQLVAVMSGSCEAVVNGAAPLIVTAHQALVLDEDETWRLRAAQPFVALFAHGVFELWAVAVTQELEVVPYDESWPASFDRITAELSPLIRDVALRIDHVGSTSVPGLAAKAIIDLDIVVARVDEVPAAIDRLISAGYRWRGDLGVTGREAFQPPPDSELPSHHLYLVVENNRAHLDHVLLRDALRNDALLRDEYGALKHSNAEIARGNMDVYVAAKAQFVAGVLARAREERGLAPVAYWVPDN
ncbi:MAG: GrpB family protein [Acidimicrobiales bacterium]